ncbi:hypothetical protein ACC674_17695, partial [Rhizobium ruizarguesonis]
LRFILWSSQWARAYFKMDYFNGARSEQPKKICPIEFDKQFSQPHRIADHTRNLPTGVIG